VTPRVLFTDVLQDIGVLGQQDRLQASDAQLALRRANDWIDMLALESMTVFYIRRDVQNLAANTASYTIGTGGAFNQPRPVGIERARLILDKNAAAANLTEVDVDVFTEQEWENVAQKGLTSPYVRGVRLDNAWTAGLATVFVWPVPTIAITQLVLHTRLALTEFPTLDVDVTYPPGYRQFIRTNLAKQFAASWGKTLTKEQIDNAKDSRALVKRSNIRPVTATLDPLTPGLVSPKAFDWRTG
jgi:hypothetical protein